MNRWRCALLVLMLGCASVMASEAAPAGFPPQALETFLETAAQETGLPRPWLEATLQQATFQPDIIAAISRPAERTLTWGQYRALFLKPDRIEAGLSFYAAHRETVDAVAEAYGVSWPYVLAILGIETRYGKFFGRWRVLDALTTLGLAYPPRQAFFAGQLRVFLQQMYAEGLDPTDRFGSYAGAMGYGQFIPSSYRDFAVDFDGDGRRDLWAVADALGSVANYLAVHRWTPGAEAARPLPSVPEAAKTLRATGLDPGTTVGALRALGVEGLSGLEASTPVALLEMEGEGGPEWIAGLPNLYVITRYNRSYLYALAVDDLAQALAQGAP
ncbi:MAG: lytic murein transglycosylase B [Pseudomonadales bacterium]|nr:lytic murein transglycosylase B [Pseudomonadales bacterium]